tara:strand:- start:225 stop:404 length:180 start_codon:yes stop_codon:yes gene_type:complete
MKITKKTRKLLNGMNKITKQNFAKGFKSPVFKDIAFPGHLPNFVKIAKGTPYVNEANFA